MKLFKSFALIIIGILSILIVSCNDPTVIGSDLLEDDLVDLQFTDTIAINAHSAIVDSVQTYNPNTNINPGSFPLGTLNDPIFGRTKSEIYFQPTLNVNFPDFDDPDLTLDSVILILPYDADNSYGNFEEEYSIEVYQMNDIFPDSILFSNEAYAADNLIGSRSYFPLPEDSTTILSPENIDSTIYLIPQLRVKLDQSSFHTNLFAIDSLRSNSVSDFEDFIKGIYIKPTSENTAMPAFRFRGGTAGLRVYYRNTVDSTFSEYLFPIFSGNVVTANYDHDPSSSMLDLENDFIGENALYKDSLLFLQGMSGMNIELEIPHASKLENIVVNKAVLELPIKFLMEDQMQYSPVGNLIVSEKLEDGSLRVINDITYAINRVGTENFDELFGGVVEADDTYRLNISSHMQDMVRGFVTNKIVITAFPKAEQAARVVVRGPKNAEGSLKLSLTFTNY